MLLTALVAFGPVSTDLYLPSLPDLTVAFGASVSQVQLTLSVFVAGFAVSQLIYGPLSDRFGRRRVLIGGVVTYFLASLVCLSATSIEGLIGGRFLQALGACSGPVIGRAIVRDVYPREQAARVLSYMASAMALAPAVAPIVGGWAHSLWGWQANFVLLCLFGAGLLIGVWLMLAETNAHPDPHALVPGRMLRTYRSLLGDRSFLGHVMTAGFSFAGLFSFISGSAFVLIGVLAVDARYFGFAFGAVVAGYIGGSFTAGRLGRRVGLERMIGAGTLLGCAAGALLAGLAFAGVATIAAVVAPMSLYFFSVGLVLPNATAAAIAPFARIAGSASAMLGCLQMGTGALAGWAVGLLHDGTTRPMAAVVLVMGVAAAATYFGMIRRAGGRAAN